MNSFLEQANLRNVVEYVAKRFKVDSTSKFFGNPIDFYSILYDSSRKTSKSSKPISGTTMKNLQDYLKNYPLESENSQSPMAFINCKSYCFKNGNISPLSYNAGNCKIKYLISPEDNSVAMGQVSCIIQESHSQKYFLEVIEFPSLLPSDVSKNPYCNLRLSHATMRYAEGGKYFIIREEQIISHVSTLFCRKDVYLTSFDTYLIVEINYPTL